MVVSAFDVTAVRAAYPLLRELAYFNTGTYGLMAESVSRRYLDDVARFEQRGMAGVAGFPEAINRARQRIAARIGAAEDEIALSGNATDGVAFVAAGWEWSPGDEIIISDQEHPAMRYPWHYIAQRRGLVVRHFAVQHDPEANLAAIRALITPRTRLIGTSQVTSSTGTRLPVREVCALARAHGALSLVDGAQSFAVLPIDVQEIGCDFLTSNTHKWLGGPKGSGFLYARRDLMERLAPAYVGAGSLQRFSADEVILQPDGRRFEFGTRAFAIHAGINWALDWFDELGWDAISLRIAQLTDYLKRQLAELDGLELRTPRAWEQSSGLVTFRVPGRDETALQRQLEANRLFPRTLGQGSEQIRVSCALFNAEDELDRLVATVREFLADGAGMPLAQGHARAR
jgi:selenocysteine lyase/cysteine desulfurase